MDPKQDQEVEAILSLIVARIKETEPARVDSILRQRDSKDRQTPLHYCAIRDYPSAMKLLIKESEEVDKQVSQRVDQRMVKRVVNIQDKEGRTALYFACKENSTVMAQNLLEAGGSFGRERPSMSTRKYVEMRDILRRGRR